MAPCSSSHYRPPLAPPTRGRGSCRIGKRAELLCSIYGASWPQYHAACEQSGMLDIKVCVRGRGTPRRRAPRTRASLLQNECPCSRCLVAAVFS